VSDHQGSEEPDDEDSVQAVIQGMDFIFDVKKIDKLIANDPIAFSNPDLMQRKVSMESNRLMIYTALLTMANESEMHDVEQLPMGPERCESKYAMIKKLLQEQTNCLKIGNLHQCLHRIYIIRAIDNEEAGNVVMFFYGNVSFYLTTAWHTLSL